MKRTANWGILRPLPIGLLITLVALCSACSGGGGDDSDNRGSSPDSAQEDDAGNPDTGEDDNEGVAAYTYCPSPDQSAVGRNTLIKVTAQQPFDPQSVSTDAVTLRCNGIDVSGTVTVNQRTILFTPETPLPAQGSCRAEVSPDVQDVNGDVAESLASNFSVGESFKADWAFDEPTFLQNGNHRIHKTLLSDGSLIYIHSNGASLYASVSRDGGETYTTSVVRPAASVFGTIEDADAVLTDNGVLHVFWRQLPANQPAEAIYNHSIGDDLSRFDTPLIVSSLSDYQGAFGPTIERDSTGRVYLSWRNECGIDTAGFCDSDTAGIQLLVLDETGETALSLQQLSDVFAEDPDLAFLSNQMFLSWRQINSENERQAVRVLNYSDGLSETATLGGTDKQIFDHYFVKYGDYRALIYWDADINADKRFYVSDFNTQTNTVTNPKSLLPSDANFDSSCATMTTSSDQIPVWLLTTYLRADGDADLQFERTIYFASIDNPTEFTPVTNIDFLSLPRIVPHNSPISDTACPGIAVDQNQTIFLAWTRTTETSDGNEFELLATKGEAVRPCAQ